MIGHDEFGFSDPDYQNAHGQYGGLAPEPCEDGCCCSACMQAQRIEDEQRKQEALVEARVQRG